MKRNRIVFASTFVFLLLVLGTACKKDLGLVSEETMELVMADFYMLEGTFEVKRIPLGDSLKTDAYNSILNKYGITKADYDSSLVYYANDVKKLHEMHDRVLDRLTNLEKEIKKGAFNRIVAPNDSLDSVFVKVATRNYYLNDKTPLDRTKFEIKDSLMQRGDEFRVRFRANSRNKNQITGNSTITIHYKDSSLTKESFSVKVDSVHFFSFRLKSDSTKDIDRISGYFLEPEKVLSNKQQVEIGDISIIRVFNPFRKR